MIELTQKQLEDALRATNPTSEKCKPITLVNPDAPFIIRWLVRIWNLFKPKYHGYFR